MPTGCAHIEAVEPVEPNTTKGCEECLELDMEWVQLRVCQECGHVGCCDSSEGKHATGHFRQTGHPVIEALEDDWLWCYEHETYDE